MRQPRFARVVRAGVVLGWSIALLAAPFDAFGQAAEKDTLAVQGNKVYREAVSQMNVGNFQQAADLFSQVIKRFGGNENVPGSQLYLASCLLRQNKDEEALKQIDLTARVYAGTEIGLLAQTLKMTYYIGKKNADGFLEALNEASGPSNRTLPNYMLEPGTYTYYFSNVQNLRYAFARDFMDDVLKLIKTPEHAEEALAALAGTFKLGPDRLPDRWFWTHCYLLFTAGKQAEAEKTFKEYADYWDQDDRGRKLWWAYAEYLRTVAKQPEAARAACETIMQRFEGTDTAADAGQRIAEVLAADDAGADAFIAFAEKFIARYRLTDGGNRVQALLLKKVMDLAPKDPKMAERAFAMLQEEMDRMLPPDRVVRLETQVRLAAQIKQMPKAVALFNEMLGDELWSATTWNKAVALGRAFPELQPAVDASRRRRQIFEMPTAAQQATSAPADQPDLAAALEAAKLLAQLKTRIADQQMRFAEEIAEEMFTKYTDTAPTVEAVDLMCDYYFKQVLVEPRDKWMERMITTYPYHPRTEEVLNKRCISDRASAEYDKLTRNVELALGRFASSQHRGAWYNHRLTCYETAKDNQGRYEWMAKELDWSASHGHTYSIQLIVGAIPVAEGQDRNEIMADAYLKWHKRLGETHLGLWCYSQANAIYTNRYSFKYDKGIVTCKYLREQKINPAVAWANAYSDIDLMLVAGKVAEACAEAGRRLPGDPRPQFRTYRRLDMTALGQAFGKQKQIGAAKTLSDRLAKLYKIPEDVDAAELMLAAAYAGAEYPKTSPRAAEIYLRVAERMDPPDLGDGLILSAAHHASGVKKYDDVLTAYMRRIPRAHHLLPGLLNKLGQHFLAQQDRRVFQIQGQLVGSYAASAARDELDDRIEKARQAAQNKR